MHPTLFALFAAVLALFAARVEAGVFFNAPKSGYEWDASAEQLIKWRESGSGNHTTLAELGTLTVTLLATSNKTVVANLGTVAASAKEFSVKFPTNVGKSANQYYIHVTSNSVDREYTSKKFALTNMTSTSFVAAAAAVTSSTNTTRAVSSISTATAARTTSSSKSSTTSGTSRSATCGTLLALLCLVSAASQWS